MICQPPYHEQNFRFGRLSVKILGWIHSCSLMTLKDCAMLPQNASTIIQNFYHSPEVWQLRRSTHDQYSVPAINYPAWVMKLAGLRGDERILDVGTGPGLYYDAAKELWPNVDYVALDYSAGMLKLNGATQRLRASVEQIPFPTGSFDVVMANHMIYLAPDIPAALAEMRRVLTPNGVFIAATSSLQSMPQFRELFRRAILLVSPPGSSRDVTVPSGMHQRFALENGTRQLAQYYRAVVRHDLPGKLIFPAVDPIMDYLESTRAVREPQLPPNIRWEQVMMIMREQLNNLVYSMGQLEVDKLSGVLIASDGGGFIQSFMEQQRALKRK